MLNESIYGKNKYNWNVLMWSLCTYLISRICTNISNSILFLKYKKILITLAGFLKCDSELFWTSYSLNSVIENIKKY